MTDTQRDLQKQSEVISFSIIAFLFLRTMLTTLVNYLNPTQNVLAFLRFAIYLVSILVPIFILNTGKPLDRNDIFAKSDEWQKKNVLLLFMSAVFLAVLLNTAFDAAFEIFSLRSAFLNQLIPTNALTWICYILVNICLPTILEEVLFRGQIQHRLAGYGPIFSIIVTAILFALSQMDISRICGYFVIGLFLGWVADRSKSLIPGMLFHGIFRLVCYTDFLLSRLSREVFTILNTFIVLATGVCLILVIINFFMTRQPQRMREARLHRLGTEQPVFRFFSSIPAIALVLAVLFLMVRNVLVIIPATP